MTTSPFTNSEQWGHIYISGLDMPGIIVSVDGYDRPYEWATQKAIGLGGAFSIYRGENLVDSIKVLCKLVDDAAFQYAERFHKHISPRKGQRASAFRVEHPAFAWVGIERVRFNVIPAPKPGSNGAWQGEYVLGEYRPPKPVPMGPADPAKIDGPPKPKDAIEQRVVDLLDKIERA